MKEANCMIQYFKHETSWSKLSHNYSQNNFDWFTQSSLIHNVELVAVFWNAVFEWDLFLTALSKTGKIYRKLECNSTIISA